jgi:DNA-binding beta-propeller fold protein YncE
VIDTTAQRGPGRGYFVTGGTMRPDAPSYIVRRADGDLDEAIEAGEYCTILSSRQMGKSSLMVRAATRWRREGASVAVVDLSAIGQNLTPDQWYGGVLAQIGEQLDLEDELEAFFMTQGHLGPIQRFSRALRRQVLPSCEGRVVIFVDEIDAVRSIDFSTDELFAAIRELYNRRAHQPELDRLCFCLIGVATPMELVKDTRTTPFNVGKRIQLTDISLAEVMALAPGLGREAAEAHALLARIHHWTGGQPYLTQRLCQAVAGDPSISGDAGVDAACAEHFLTPGAREHDDNLVFVRERALRGDGDPVKRLRLYRSVWEGHDVAEGEDEQVVEQLRLAGIIGVECGRLRVRNEIYRQVFDGDWIVRHLLDAPPSTQAPAAPAAAPTAHRLELRRVLKRPGDGADLYFTATALCVDNAGALYVVESTRHRVQKRLPDGTVVTYSGSRESGVRLRDPVAIAVSPRLFLYVLEADNARVVIIDEATRPVETFGTYGGGEGQLRGPRGICIDSQRRLMVADTGNDRVHVFDYDGKPTACHEYAAAGGLSQPQGVWCGWQGDVIVCDTGNARLVFADLDGAVTGTLEGTAKVPLETPIAACRDAEGCLWVVDESQSMVLKCDPTGEPLFAIGPKLGSRGRISGAGGIAFAPDGSFYILDRGNSRVLHFGYGEPEETTDT